MKKAQLLEWGIITIGLIFGYKFFEGVINALVQLLYSFQGVGSGDIAGFLLPLLFMIVIYAVSFVLLIKRSGQIASYFLEDNSNETLPVKIGKKTLLQVILISICLITILANIPDLILYLYESFKEKVGRYNPENDYTSSLQWHQFKLNVIQVVFSAVIIYFSRDISQWFLRKKEIDELSFESDTQNQQK